MLVIGYCVILLFFFLFAALSHSVMTLLFEITTDSPRKFVKVAAVSSLIFAVASMLLIGLTSNSLFVSFLGIVAGRIALANQPNRSQRKIATAGLILSVLSLAFTAFIWILLDFMGAPLDGW